ncbi:MAG: MotA/TolQ/ExbB proton channel family protein [Phycisphaeraceae bacterium]|nr:MotA/TolQ/ExbB proton channel family protein [Phycisphaeraceae bacterium]
MIHQFSETFWRFMDQGGRVMWPLLAVSLVGVTLILERAWFWMTQNHPANLQKVRRLLSLLRAGDRAAAQTLSEGDRSVYARVVVLLLREGVGDAVLTEAIESQRNRIERFMPTLSTVITVAPMLGILGTVTGIIASFNLLATDMPSTDPRAVSAGIAEALLTTAAGLVIAIVVLFPYNAYRAQIDRTLGRLEALASAAKEGLEKKRPAEGV